MLMLQKIYSTKRLNKLNRAFVASKHFQPSLTFVSQPVPTWMEELSGTPFYDRILASLVTIKRAEKLHRDKRSSLFDLFVNLE